MPTIEEIKAKKPEERTPEEAAQLAAAERKTDDAGQMIPKARLDEVIAEREAARAETARLKKAQDDAQADALKEQGKWKELAEQRQRDLEAAQGRAGLVDGYEKTLADTLKAQLAELPEALRGLVPDELSTPQKLAWLSKNKAALMKPAAQDIGAGNRGGGKPPETKVELAPDVIAQARAFGYTPEEYAKFMSNTQAEPFEKQEQSKEK